MESIEERKAEDMYSPKTKLSGEKIINNIIWGELTPSIRNDPELGAVVQKAYVLGNSAAICLNTLVIAEAGSHPEKLSFFFADLRTVPQEWNSVQDTKVTAAGIAALKEALPKLQVFANLNRLPAERPPSK